MFYANDEIRQNNDFGYGENIDININNTNFNDNLNTFNSPQMSFDNQTMNFDTVQGPIIEPGRERVIQRNIVHEVKQETLFLID